MNIPCFSLPFLSVLIINGKALSREALSREQVYGMSSDVAAAGAGDDVLALNGGQPAISADSPLPPMFPGGMRIGQEEEDAVVEVIRSKGLYRWY